VLEVFGPFGVIEFEPVSAGELGEPVRVMAVPPAQGRRWGDLLAPLVEVGPVLGQPRGQSRSTSTRVPSWAVRSP
jgi:hypothetical protein